MDPSNQLKIGLIFFKIGLERRGYHQSQVYPCVFYRKYSVILTYVDHCIIVSFKEDTITSLMESLDNGTKNYVLTDEGDISNYLGVNIKINPDGILDFFIIASGRENNQPCRTSSVCEFQTKRDARWKTITE